MEFKPKPHNQAIVGSFAETEEDVEDFEDDVEGGYAPSPAQS